MKKFFCIKKAGRTGNNGSRNITIDVYKIASEGTSVADLVSEVKFSSGSTRGDIHEVVDSLVKLGHLPDAAMRNRYAIPSDERQKMGILIDILSV